MQLGGGIASGASLSHCAGDENPCRQVKTFLLRHIFNNCPLDKLPIKSFFKNGAFPVEILLLISSSRPTLTMLDLVTKTNQTELKDRSKKIRMAYIEIDRQFKIQLGPPDSPVCCSRSKLCGLPVGFVVHLHQDQNILYWALQKRLKRLLY